MVGGFRNHILVLSLLIAPSVFAKDPRSVPNSRCEQILSSLQSIVTRFRSDSGLIRQELEDALPQIAYDLWQKEIEKGQELPITYTLRRIYGARIDLLRRFYARQNALAQIAKDEQKATAGDSEGLENLESEVLNDRLKRVFLELPDEMQEFLRLKVIEGLSFTQISRLTGIPDGTLKSRYTRILNQLKARLENLSH